MAEFGYHTIGGSNNGTSTPIGTKFTAPGNGTITTISIYMNTFSGTQPLSAAVYSDNGGVPDALLAQDSGDATATTTPQWIDLGLSLAITSGTVYWLIIWQGGTNGQLFYDANGTTGQSRYSQGDVYESWDNPWNETGGGGGLDWQLSIYATYTPAGGGGLTIIGRSVLDDD